VSDWTIQSQAANAAAHLCDIVSARHRSGDMSKATWEALAIASEQVKEAHGARWYRNALTMLGLAPEAIDAAVAAILAGCHPATSLPGQVIRLEEEAREVTRYQVSRWHSGAACAFGHTLDLLGCKATPPQPETSHPRACRGDLCSVCGRCLGCYLCKCPGAPVHPDDVPAVGSLPSDKSAGVP
jgi:hypothetical protein